MHTFHVGINKSPPDSGDSDCLLGELQIITKNFHDNFRVKSKKFATQNFSFGNGYWRAEKK